MPQNKKREDFITRSETVVDIDKLKEEFEKEQQKQSMIMKTTKEMIDVMQAYERGEQIQVLDIGCIWEDTEHPYWNWTQCDYRVKPKQKFVPFDTAEEFLAAQREHEGGIVCIEDGCVFGWHDVSVTLYGHVFLHERNKSCEVVNFYGNLLDLFEGFKMADGAPCGKEVK